jgi:hypothetical protein
LKIKFLISALKGQEHTRACLNTKLFMLMQAIDFSQEEQKMGHKLTFM